MIVDPLVLFQVTGIAARTLWESKQKAIHNTVQYSLGTSSHSRNYQYKPVSKKSLHVYSK